MMRRCFATRRLKLWGNTSSNIALRHRYQLYSSSISRQNENKSLYIEEFVYNPVNIRNFSIIAHIDHGKSTLADRLLEITGTVSKTNMQNQLLDSMDIERERGITIKLNTARMNYRANDGKQYLLNLIDTPGHVDFGYEVSRSLAACEGALLVVDASQGVEAQTIANVYLALENNLEIIPILNKIDLPTALPDQVKQEIENTIGLDCTNAIPCSAKLGLGVDNILEAIVQHLPPPSGSPDAPLQALIFDSYYDVYRGIIVQFRVVNGSVKKGDEILFMNSGKVFEVLEVGIQTPTQHTVDILRAGEVGYLHANIKSVEDARVGDTITLSRYQSSLEGVEDSNSTNNSSNSISNASTPSQVVVKPLPGYLPAKPMVYAGLYPSDADQYELLRDSIQKLKLNDSALSFTPETSSAMGFGFRCGFLGLLHMDIVQERLEREYNINLIVTAPSVRYKIIKANGEEEYIDSPAKLPESSSYEEIQEPYVRLEIIAPSDYTGALMKLTQNRRGEFIEMKYLTPTRTSLVYEMPLAEVITDYFDSLKSVTKGYASMSFSEIGYRKNALIKLDIRINQEEAPPLAMIVHREKAYDVGRIIVSKLKEHIPRQLFRIPIQACIGSKVIAAEHISPMRKDVLAKCYGGDVTRKKKLLAKQAEGKKRLKAIGKVSVPQEAFLAVIRMNSEAEKEN